MPERWQGWAAEGALQPLFAELMALHYDPLYARSQSTHLYQWAQRQPVQAQNLTDEGIARVAQDILALP